MFRISIGWCYDNWKLLLREGCLVLKRVEGNLKSLLEINHFPVIEEKDKFLDALYKFSEVDERDLQDFLVSNKPIGEGL